MNEIIEKIEQYSGRSVIVNKSYSGTQIIHDYGERQMDTGELIIYTSGDSVMQIAAHEDAIPLEELYDICRYARTLVAGIHRRSSYRAAFRGTGQGSLGRPTGMTST